MGNVKSVPACMRGLLYSVPCGTIIFSMNGKLPTTWLPLKKQIGFLFLIFFLAVPLAYSNDRVVVVKLSGAINPAVTEYVSHEISQANAEKDALIVLHMDVLQEQLL